tara:strand:+ start:103 stop:402 length:300 start_codon:yes stop_codon:yes gene_type:complete
MKISKKILQHIIKEEAAKILKEQPTRHRSVGTSNPQGYSAGQTQNTANPEAFKTVRAPMPGEGRDEEAQAVATAIQVHSIKLEKIIKALKELGKDITIT